MDETNLAIILEYSSITFTPEIKLNKFDTDLNDLFAIVRAQKKKKKKKLKITDRITSARISQSPSFVAETLRNESSFSFLQIESFDRYVRPALLFAESKVNSVKPRAA